MQEITCPLPQPSDPQPVTSYSPAPEANRGGLQVKENLYMRGDSTFLHFLLKMRQTRLRMLRTWGLSEVTWTALCGTPTIYLHFIDIISSPASSHYPMRKVRLGKTEQLNTASK